MARFDRLTVYNTILDDGMVPLFYHADVETAKAAVGAIARGGGRILEFTNRGDFALSVFSQVIQWAAAEFPALVMGVGSVEDAPTAALYLAHGANFMVGPNFNPDIARLCNRRKTPYMPGCSSVTEIAVAEEAGIEIVKLFPGDVFGPKFVKAVRGPRPWTRIMPTGGVSPDETNLRGWFEAGVACVGMGSKLVRGDWLKAGAFDKIEQLVSQTLATIRSIRA
jgi:2-dehydro-3-deoxyphosphogluconate aldolase/(4S)-4-hydroxy-2-oxoglutarate aldolase